MDWKRECTGRWRGELGEHTVAIVGTSSLSSKGQTRWTLSIQKGEIVLHHEALTSWRRRPGGFPRKRAEYAITVWRNRRTRPVPPPPPRRGAVTSHALSATERVRNPVLGLPSVQRLRQLPDGQRAMLSDLLLDIRRDALDRAEKCWQNHKAPMACYWKAVGVYAGHIARAIRA